MRSIRRLIVRAGPPTNMTPRTHKLIIHLSQRNDWTIGYKLNGPRFGSDADTRCREFRRKGYLRSRINDKGHTEFKVTRQGISYAKKLA